MIFKNPVFLSHPPNFMLLFSLSLSKINIHFSVYGSFVSRGFIAFRDKLFSPVLGSWDGGCCHTDSYSSWRMSHSQVSWPSSKTHTRTWHLWFTYLFHHLYTRMYALPSISAVSLPLSSQISRCWNSTIFLRSSSNILSKRPSSEPQTFISHHLHTLAHVP